MQKERIEIDYLEDDCTGAIAFKITYYSAYGHPNVYKSPFVFESTEDAYHSAINEISSK